MAKLENIWIEKDLTEVGIVGRCEAIRIDWSNDRHQRAEIKGDSPEDVIMALEFAIRLLKSEIIIGKI